MLDSKAIQKFKNQLLEEKKRLEADLSKLANKDGENYETKFEDIERNDEANADEFEQYVDDLAVTETLDKNLKEVEAALERIKSGTYGLCSNCDKEIPVARLEVYPAAVRCLDCAK